MHTLLATLHVVAAVFLIGPLAVIPMTGLRGIRKQDGPAVRDAARQTMLYGLLSLIVFGLGLAVVPTEDDDYSFGSAWIVISITLYVIAVLVVLLVVAPSLGQAAKLLATGSTVGTSSAAGAAAAGRDAAEVVSPGPPETPLPQDPGGSGPTAPLVGSGRPSGGLAADAVRKLDAVRGRVAITSGISALLLLLITVLMVTRPFGE